MSARFVAAALASAALLFCPSSARASGVLAPASEDAPTTLDVQIAVANGTRWSRVHASGTSRVMWLVPARPGAAVDWAPGAWLDALDDASAPRVTPPDWIPPCELPTTPERVATFGDRGTQRTPSAILVHTTEPDARAHIAARGFAVSAAAAARIAEIYAAGSALVSLELQTPFATSTPTLRVSDDGPPLLPLALTGSTRTVTRVTAFVLGASAASTAGAVDIDETSLVWGRSQSSYAAQRAGLFLGGTWLRESASRTVLFEGFGVPGHPPVAAALDTYFRGAAPGAWLACTSAAHGVSRSDAPAGRTCAPGALATVPGGPSCTPSIGEVESALACDGAIDLAIALSGIAPARATVTRVSGIVPRGSLGADLALSWTVGSRPPLSRAARYGDCYAVTSPEPTFGEPSSPREDTSSTSVDVFVRTPDGCSGSSTTTGQEPDDTGSDPTSSSGCSGDTATSSTGSDTGWDDDDDNDGCSGDTSTSSETGTSSSSDDEGWDDDDDSSSPDACASSTSDAGAKVSRRKPSRVSRYAMLFAFVVLPLRRRLRRFR